MKTSTIKRVEHSVPAGLERYCRGLDTWPRSWMGWEKDLPHGEKLVACFRSFLEYLVCSDLSPKTIQTHVDNLWLLGGEIIRDLNEDPSLRKLPVDRVLRDAIYEDGGPLIHKGLGGAASAISTRPAASSTASYSHRNRARLRGEKADAINRLMHGSATP